MGRSTLKKRIAVYFVAGLVSIIGTAACGGGEQEPQQPKQEEPKQEPQQKKDQPY